MEGPQAWRRGAILPHRGGNLSGNSTFFVQVEHVQQYLCFIGKVLRRSTNGHMYSALFIVGGLVGMKYCRRAFET